MPQCFQLIPKGETKPATLGSIDEAICFNVLHVPVHPKKYGGDYSVEGSFDWFNTIGFQIAIGNELGSIELREHFANSDLWKEEYPLIHKIIDYLEKHYTSVSFYSTK